MDVSALYTNIPHGEGIGACKSALEKWRDPNSTPSSSFLCDLIKIILTCNCFQFADDMWLQIHGAAMGTCMTPSYANLFMDTFNYLLWSSCHPYHTKKNIPYSLAFCLIRICSSEEDLTNRLHQLSLHLQTRGYPLRHIKSAIAKAKQIPRHSAIQKRNNVTTNKNERIPFVLTYNPALPNISSILKTYLPILHSSDRCKKAIPSLPVTAFRRPKNLRDLLVHSSTHHTNNIGFSPCLSPRCKTCIYTHTTSSFKSSTDGQTYKITQGPLTCNSNNIIYLITCQKFFKQYVGQTCQTLRSRFNHHRFTIHNDRDTPVAKHFNLIDHNIQHLKIIAIDHLPHSDTISRLNKETFWIHNGTTRAEHE
ncbi:hypothetical protein PoB_003082100 [Plakobranchus ocellatus]|uniref:GIY-YIG domain-containing protein n=1 Tax=Plakobranchus ocellatus TaxID=259542 RepID=A0AAV3ZZA8_9GAST|nr:hypothetical protein PoB_003082100 [Plakobranchus ocellatus]